MAGGLAGAKQPVEFGQHSLPPAKHPQNGSGLQGGLGANRLGVSPKDGFDFRRDSYQLADTFKGSAGSGPANHFDQACGFAPHRRQLWPRHTEADDFLISRLKGGKVRPVVLHISMVSTAAAPMSRPHVLSKWVRRVQGQRERPLEWAPTSFLDVREWSACGSTAVSAVYSWRPIFTGGTPVL